MKITANLIILPGVLTIALIINGCNKEEKEEPQGKEVLSGSVYYAKTTIPVADVVLNIDGKSDTTGGDGKYTINGIRDGNQTLIATKEGFDDYSVDLQIDTLSNIHDVEMISFEFAHDLTGTVRSNIFNNIGPVDSCKVVVLLPDHSESKLLAYTSSNGYYQISIVPDGDRTVRFIAKDHEMAELSIMMEGNDYELNMDLNYEHLGKPFQGGVVGYVFQPGDSGYVEDQIHGFIVAPTNVNNEQWGCYGASIGETSTSLGTGASNTAKIISSCYEIDFAARLCDEFELNGYSDWFLVSKDELNILFQNRSYIGGFIDDSPYWSSSESSSDEAWIQYFPNGYQLKYFKNFTCIVRPVRTF